MLEGGGHHVPSLPLLRLSSGKWEERKSCAPDRKSVSAYRLPFVASKTAPAKHAEIVLTSF